jgi:hypothetical protein
MATHHAPAALDDSEGSRRFSYSKSWSWVKGSMISSAGLAALYRYRAAPKAERKKAETH